jgi:5-methylcytosine-specific restriction protein A
MSMIKTITEYFAGLPSRSPRWSAVRGAHLKRNPTCAACGTKEKLEVHHVHPFHLFPNLELEPSNLLTLCETGGNCHIMLGHLKHWKSYNLGVRKDAEVLLQKIKARP